MQEGTPPTAIHVTSRDSLPLIDGRQAIGRNACVIITRKSTPCNQEFQKFDSTCPR